MRGGDYCVDNLFEAFDLDELCRLLLQYGLGSIDVMEFFVTRPTESFKVLVLFPSEVAVVRVMNRDVFLR